MSVVLACRLEDEVAQELEVVARKNNRKKSFLMNEAIKDYLFDQKEADIALARKNDKNDMILSSEEATEYLRNKYNV